MKIDYSNSNKYIGQPEFLDTEWCWLEVYAKNNDTDYEIIPQFYSQNGNISKRNIKNIEIKKLIGFQVVHNSGKVVSFDTKFANVNEIVYFYRNVRNFDTISGIQGNLNIRYPIQGYEKIDENGKKITWQCKLFPDGDTMFTDDYK